MGFQCGLVGLPNVGKSTIFNAMTNLRVEASAYPFCTIDPHHGIVPLEDERLEAVRRVVGSAKGTPTVLEFVDIAGLVEGASRGEGLGNQFLSHIGSVDAVAYVLRCFEDANVAHAYDTLDPVRDARLVARELVLKDEEWIRRRLEKSRTAAKSGDPQIKKEIAILEDLLAGLSENGELRFFHPDPVLRRLMQQMNLLTMKPALFIANVDERQLGGSPLLRAVASYAESLRTPCIPFCGKLQEEISRLDPVDQREYLKAMGLAETGLQKLVKAGYRALDLITFYTANENEARAWTVVRGTTAVEAAGKVHTDFARRFIKAEVVPADDLIALGSMKSLHDAGRIQLQGKQYVVQDGDVILFKV